MTGKQKLNKNLCESLKNLKQKLKKKNKITSIDSNLQKIIKKNF